MKQSSHSEVFDAVVIGGGYFGCRIALHLRALGLERVVVAEIEPTIMRRASFANQARIHGGYHYPRHLQTGLASRRSYRQFIAEHDYAVDRKIWKLYGIARGSFVSPGQFERFCRSIDAPLHPTPPTLRSLFDHSLIDETYLVEETAFNSHSIARRLSDEMAASGVELRLNTKAHFLGVNDQGLAEVELGEHRRLCRLLINCTYAGLDTVGVKLNTPLRKEWAELALVTPPRQLSTVSVTIMDGPYFSFMPFPALSKHTLSHVRYTPVAAWHDPGDEPRLPLASGIGPALNGQAMIRDASRYIPSLRHAQLEGSIYEIKTVLIANERNDGRPILLEQASDAPCVISILGGKIDNIYDALEFLDGSRIADIVK